MRKAILSTVFMTTVGLAAASICNAAIVLPSDDDELMPTGKGWGQRVPPGLAKQPPGNAKPQGNNGIFYHGGPLILGTTNTYYIWYGNWSGNSAITILSNLAGNIGGSPYFNINTTYFDGSNAKVNNSVHFGGSTNDNYSHGTALSDSDIQAVVSSAISSGRLPNDTNAVYFVLTSSDVNETSGFCTQYCGWHTHGTIAGSDIKYSFVGNPDRCPSACRARDTLRRR